MGNKRHVRRALEVLAVVALLPAGAFAGAPADPVPDPHPHYSSWHYRTPLLSRYCEEYHLWREARRCPVYYPPGPYGYGILTCPDSPTTQPDFRSGAASTPPAAAPDTAPDAAAAKP